MMRIITGSARGVRLETLEGEEITRPTAERVKEAIFSAIQFETEGRHVLDLFGGSGTTLIAAEQTGRRCRMLELDERYADVIVKRFESLTGQKGILLWIMKRILKTLMKKI